MIYIFELQNLLKNIHSIKEFKILFDILSEKQKIDNFSAHKELNNIIAEIDGFDSNRNQFYNGGILYKLTTSNWLYFKQKNGEIFKGYIDFKNTFYFFEVNILNLIEIVKKYIPDISLEQLNEIQKLASLGKTTSQISYELKLRKDIISLVWSIYQSEIYQNFKENFINLVVSNTNEKEIRETLNVSKKKYKYYLEQYSDDINKAISCKQNKLLDFYPNGIIRLMCPYENGLIDGKVSIYKENGNLYKEIDFVKGQIKGSIKIYDSDGKYTVRKINSNMTKINNNVINDENISERDLYENAIKLNWEVLEFIPDKYKTEEICMIAFNQNALAIKHFPEKYLTQKILELAIKRNMLTFKIIPDKFKTKELSEMFFEKYFRELKYIPYEHRTKSMCIRAFDANEDNFKYFPDEFKTKDICKRAVEYNGNLIACVPARLIDTELCLLAVRQNGLSIKYIPDNYKRQDIVIEAIKQDYHAISLVKIHNENELAILIKNNNELFKHLPPKVKSKNLCLTALHNNIENIKYIPSASIDESMCRYFLSKAIKKKFTDKAHWINTIKNRAYILQIGILDKNLKDDFVSEDLEKDNIISFNNKEDSYEDILNNYKYKNQEDLVKIENSNDKIFNYTLIKKYFEKQYPNFVGNLSKINKNSSNLKIKTSYKNIYYVWLFRNDALEILLEFNSDIIELTKYFNSIEKELKQHFSETLIVGQTKTKIVVYISTVKYSIKWAIENMSKFISVINNKLEIFYNDKNNNDVINQDNNSENSLQNYKDIDNSEENTEENDIFEEQEYVNLNIVDGQSSTVQLTRYERNPKNRAEAIKIHGTTCLACGFNFNEFYGEDLAKNFIEIHHIKPVSKGEYTVNPKTDLVPLCSNCHSMIHKEKNPPKTIEEIKNRYKRY